MEEGRWGRDELAGAEEAFATRTGQGVVPITSLDGRAFPASEAAPRLFDAYWRRVAEEAE